MAKCEYCGHETRMWRHKINKGLVQALWQLYKFGKPANLQKDLNLTKNQYNNFQKMQHFDLVHKIKETSLWEITERGRLFCEGENTISDIAFSLNGKTIEADPFEVDFSHIIHIKNFPDIPFGYKKREDYLND